MKILRNNTFQSWFMLVFFLTLVEIVFRLISGSTIFTYGFLRNFIGINIISLLFGSLTSMTKPKVTLILNSLLVFIASFYAWVQLGFYNFIGVYMSVNASGQLGAVVSYIIDFVKSMSFEYYLIFIPFILNVIAHICYFKKVFSVSRFFQVKHYYNHYKLITSSIIIMVLCSLGGLYYYFLDDAFMSDKYQVVSNKSLFMTASNPGLCVKEFGVLPFAFIDINSLFSDATDSSVGNVENFENPPAITDREFDDTNWEILIEEEQNKTYNKLNNYFINAEITTKNEMTGLFEGKNLIMIMMESVNDIIYNPEYFPNFSKMASEGWYFENNYSPRNSCATGNNEFSALTGLYSIYNTCTANTYYNNKYNTAIFNLFNDNAYYTNSFHNFTESYYYRRKYHPNMGSQAYYDANSLKMDFYTYYGGWASDVDLIDEFFDKMDLRTDSSPFMSFITTVTPHQPYSSSPYGDMYLEMTQDTGYSMNLRRYMSKLKVTDNALGALLTGLEERGILDDTVIILFGDHYPYGLNKNVLSEALDRSLEDYDVEKTPLVIYNSEITAKEYDTYTSYVNLTPTIANLFNLDFDPRLYTGQDIFSKEYDNIVVFANSSWKNDKAYYDASTGEIKYYTDFTYTDEEIKEINSKIYNQMNVSQLAIKNNYFEYLKNKLRTINERNETLE